MVGAQNFEPLPFFAPLAGIVTERTKCYNERRKSLIKEGKWQGLHRMVRTYRYSV